MSDNLDLVLERTINAPRDLVWKAWTNPEHLKRWFSPKPYEISEIEMNLRPGGIFRIRMVGPDGFDTSHGNAGCMLEIVEGERLVWTSALGPDYRPAELATEGCESFPMTAIVTLADAGDGKTLYRAVALHRNLADRDVHEKMGFQDGWGKCADQLEELAQGSARPPERAAHEKAGRGLAPRPAFHCLRWISSGWPSCPPARRSGRR